MPSNPKQIHFLLVQTAACSHRISKTSLIVMHQFGFTHKISPILILGFSVGWLCGMSPYKSSQDEMFLEELVQQVQKAQLMEISLSHFQYIVFDRSGSLMSINLLTVSRIFSSFTLVLFSYLYDYQSVSIALQPLPFFPNSYLIFLFIIIKNGTNKKSIENLVERQTQWWSSRSWQF